MVDAINVANFLIDNVLSVVELYQELSYEENALSDVEEIKGDLSEMQACLQDAEGSVGSGDVMKNLVEKIRDAAHDMEDILDEFMIHAPRPFSRHRFLQKGYEFAHRVKHRGPVQGLQYRIEGIKTRLSEIKSLPQFQNLIGIVSYRQRLHAQPELMEGTNVVEEDEIVGIDSARDNLINLLNVSSTRCKTIWVVGPGGAGKTVIVNSVYQSKKVIAQFDCHAWLSVTRSQEREQLLQSLLSQFCMGVNELHSSLRGGTDYFNGSRIIVTTRNAEVAEKCVASEDHILSVTGLDWKHSWELFCLKAFRKHKRQCPPDLLDLSEKIVIRCEGMPQAISAVGSLLSRKPKLQAEWIRIHDNLGSQMQDNCISTMLLPSYYDLPSNLKSCLLYFSILPEDRSIKRERLIRLWVSEGFINKSGSKSSDEIAKDYLNELISRSLVHATSRDLNGQVKSCRVLNLNREFLLLKSREEKFATGISDFVMGSWEKIRRLSFQNASSTDLTRYTGVRLDKVRSLFVFGLDNIASSMIGQKTLQAARLLKVLDLENAPLEGFPVSVLSATLLRYLSLIAKGDLLTAVLGASSSLSVEPNAI